MSDQQNVQVWVFTPKQAPHVKAEDIRKLRIKFGFKVVVRNRIVNGEPTFRIYAKLSTAAKELFEHMKKLMPSVPPRLCSPCNLDF